MSSYGGLTTNTGTPQGLSGAPVAVTPTSQGVLPGPIGYQLGWAVVNNSTPYLMTVVGVEGQNTIQPFFADVVRPTSVGLAYTMTPPPGPVALLPNPFVQVDWYVAGGGQPPGIFPYPLTSAALGVVQAPVQLISSNAVTATTITQSVTGTLGTNAVGAMIAIQTGASANDTIFNAFLNPGSFALEPTTLNFRKHHSDQGPSRFQLFGPPGSVVTVQYSSVAGTVGVTIDLYTINSDCSHLFAPQLTNTLQTLAATTVGTATILPLNGWHGTLSASASNGVATPTGAFRGDLFYYNAAGSFVNAWSVGGSATGPAFTADVITPPGTAEIVPVNLASASQGIVVAFSQ